MTDCEPTVGVALSGGGHRAALFAAGALFGLADAGVQRTTASVASVSGGSITNGLVANDARSFRDMERAQLEDALRPGIRVYCYEGLFFPGKGTNAYVASFFFLLGLFVASVTGLLAMAATIRRDIPTDKLVITASAVTVGVLLLTTVLSWLKRLPIAFWFALSVGLLGTAPAIVVGVPLAPDTAMSLGSSLIRLGLALVVVAALGVVTVGRLGQRSEKLDDVLHDRLFERRMLAKLHGSVEHIFCPTNLVTGNQVYLSPKFVYGYDVGVGVPAATLRLSTAVQASACFPGGFAPRRLTAKQLFAQPAAMAEPHVTALTDGGVYDNMGDQWALGWHTREQLLGRRNQSLKEFGSTPTSDLIVVNAGGAYKGGPVKGRGLGFELTALMRSKDVMYDVTTGVRRRYLVDLFSLGAQRGLHGVIVQISQTPRTVPSRLSESGEEDQRSRAAEALQFLDRLAELDPDVDWRKVRDANRGVKTVLSALGPETTTDLLHQAYVLTRINAYVVRGFGTLPKMEGADGEPGISSEDAEPIQPSRRDTDDWLRARFERFVAGAT